MLHLAICRSATAVIPVSRTTPAATLPRCKCCTNPLSKTVSNRAWGGWNGAAIRGLGPRAGRSENCSYIHVLSELKPIAYGTSFTQPKSNLCMVHIRSCCCKTSAPNATLHRVRVATSFDRFSRNPGVPKCKGEMDLPFPLKRLPHCGCIYRPHITKS
jgi:hypothetical protein